MAAPQPTTFPRLVADIGGSHARFGWVSGPGAVPSHRQTLAVVDHAGPAQAASAYLGWLAVQPGMQGLAPRHAAFAVATAIDADTVSFTNSPWHFSREAVRRALGLQTLAVINDFEALALSLPQLLPAQWQAVGGPALKDPPAARVGTMLAVLGPGTGLGVAGLLRTHRGWQALPGEGGHATLAGQDPLECEVIAIVRRQHAHVSAERLLSGTGLPLLHAARALAQGEAPPAATTAASIVAAALDGSDAGAGATLDLFCALLGGFAGNVALTLGARGGLYIGGGVVPRFAARFRASAFRQRFEAKGRFSAYLASVPTVLIIDTETALAGAAQAIDAGLHQDP